MAELLNKLIGELEGLRSQAQKTLDEHKEGLTPEARDALDKIRGEMQAKTVAIQTERADEERKADLSKVSDFLNLPEYKIQHGSSSPDENQGTDFRKSLLSAGWEVKSGISDGGGMLCAPTSLGHTVDMYPEEVLFGPIPKDDQNVAEFFTKTRNSFNPIYRSAYMKYMRYCVKVRNDATAMAMLEPEERKALVEGQDTAGGFLVPPDVQAEMLARLPTTAIMRQLARVQTTSRDQLKWPMVQPHATSSSIYSSGFVGDWAGETPAFTDTDPKFGTFDVSIKKVRVATKLSNDFVSDAVINILAWLATNGSENMALVEDLGFISGLGTALQPKGVLFSGAATVSLEGSTADTISNTTAAPGSAPKLIDLAYALPAQYTNRARWLMRRSTEGSIRKLVDGSGRYQWPEMTASGFSATSRSLLGYPVSNSEFMEADGVDARKVVVFGDFTSYIIAQRAQITSVILRERFADTDQVGIVLFERVGGDTWNPDALRIGVV